MTLPPIRLGDQGQRYQILAEGCPGDGWNIVAWANTRRDAQALAEAVFKAPSCTGVRYIDRNTCDHEFEWDTAAEAFLCTQCDIEAPDDYLKETGLDCGSGEPC